MLVPMWPLNLQNRAPSLVPLFSSCHTHTNLLQLYCGGNCLDFLKTRGDFCDRFECPPHTEVRVWSDYVFLHILLPLASPIGVYLLLDLKTLHTTSHFFHRLSKRFFSLLAAPSCLQHDVASLMPLLPCVRFLQEASTLSEREIGTDR